PLTYTQSAPLSAHGRLAPVDTNASPPQNSPPPPPPHPPPPAITAIPQPNLALSETTAAGLIAFTISNPICRTCRPTCTRRRLSPIPTNALRIPSRRSRGRSASVPRIDRPKIGEPAASRSIRPAI